MIVKMGAEYYRERARHLQSQADLASSDELRTAYQDLANNWLQLAEATEKALTRGGIAAPVREEGISAPEKKADE